MLKLYDYLDSGNGYKVRLLLSQLGRDYEMHEVDIIAGGSRTAEFLARNPNGRIPLLELEDGSYLPESNAILFYLAEGTAFLPDDRLGRARALQWLFFEQYNHEPNIASSRFLIRHRERTPEVEAQLEAKQAPGYAALDVMEGELRDRDWFVGEAYSIADIALFAYTHVAEEGGFDLGGYKAIRAWLDRVAARPGFIPMLENEAAAH